MDMNFQFRQIGLKSNWEIRKMGKYFGTDGFRGEANVVLTVEHAFKVGRFLVLRTGSQSKGCDRKRYKTQQLYV